jgi:mannose-1-phosphate guanylyltransferase / phosphomannomutase
MKAVVMAGGFGTRIQPLTNSIPKPMLPVMNRPMMENTMMSLKALGITEFIVLLYFKPEVIQAYFGDGSAFGIKITYVIPDDDYGTAGAVKLAEEHIGDDNFIIISGDLVTDFDFQSIFEYHAKRASKLTITLTSVENPLEFGVVIANEEGVIEKFLEKPSWSEVFSDTINTGIYVIEPEILDYIPKGENFDFAKDLFPLLMREGIELIAGNEQGYWRDVGNPDSYREVHEDIMNQRVQFDLPGKATSYPDGTLYSDEAYRLDEVEIIGKVILGKNVTIGKKTRLKNVVIGDHVKVDKDCKISNSVLWHDIQISKGSKIDNAVICNDNIIGKNSKMTAGIILAEGCELGELVTVDKDVTIWPNKQIEAASIINSNIILGNKYKNSIFEHGTVSGKSNVELSCEMVGKLAEAFGAQLPIDSTIVVGRDQHQSSRMLKRAFVGGLLAAGVNVLDLQNIASSVMRFGITQDEKTAGGIYFRQDRDDTTMTVITFFNEEALRINSGMAKKIEKAYFKEQFRRVDFSQIGRINESSHINLCTRYKTRIEEIFERRHFTCAGCKIAIDLMHGVSCDTFSDILNGLGIDSMVFNNYHDAHKLSNFKTLERNTSDVMQKVVGSLELDAGFLLYPFGQRLGIVCDKGSLLSMQEGLLVVLALMDREAAKEGIAKKIFLPTWAPDLISFKHLQIEYGKYADFRAEQLARFDLIATMDGNFAFTEFALYRDSMYAAIKILELCAKHEVKLSELVADVESFYHAHFKVPCSQSLKGKMMRRFLQDARDKRSSSLDGIKIWMSNTDWILMIPDQYTDHLNLYVQASSQKAGEAIYQAYQEKIARWAND